MTLDAVSLFSNCGAGDTGYAKAGFRFRVLAELDERRLEVAGYNLRGATLVPGDLTKTYRQVIRAYRACRGNRAPALLAACPPCQGMSSARSGLGRGDDPDAGSRDGRNLLVVPIARVARALQPRAIVVENVPQFLTRQVRDPKTGKPITAAALLVSLLGGQYECFPAVLELADFGVPQTRKRTFLTFIRRDERGLASLIRQARAPYPRRSHGTDGNAHVTVEEALLAAGLPVLDARLQELARPVELDPIHHVPVWPADRYRMIAAIPPRSGRAAWDTKECSVCGPIEVGPTAATCPVCGNPLLRPIVTPKRGRPRLIRGFKTSYSRMHPARPAATITTGSGHIGCDLTIHPWENRVLTPHECALLQTFPQDFEWGDALHRWGHTNVREMIGEAVPPHFTELHGLAIRSALARRWRIAALSLYDHGCLKARSKLGLDLPIAKPAG